MDSTNRYIPNEELFHKRFLESHIHKPWLLNHAMVTFSFFSNALPFSVDAKLSFYLVRENKDLHFLFHFPHLFNNNKKKNPSFLIAMAFRTLDINVISAKGLKNVNLIDKMDVYAVVSLKGDSSKQKLKTPVHKDCGKTPNWNFPVKFTVDESLAKNNKLSIKFKIMCERILGDKELGVVNVPVKELLDSPGDGGSMKFVSFQVRKPSGKPEGTLDFSYKFGDKVSEPVGKNKGDDHPHHQPVTAYPAAHVAAGSSSAVPYGGPGAYPPPPQGAGYGYPPPPPHAVAGYGGYPPQGPPPPGYGYPPPPPGYAYPPPPPGAYGYPPVQQPPKKNSKFGLGLGAGLVGGAIGGMLIGDMVSDAADYDGGFDGGFDF